MNIYKFVSPDAHVRIFVLAMVCEESKSILSKRVEKSISL